jgi:hypothetical protein
VTIGLPVRPTILDPEEISNFANALLPIVHSCLLKIASWAPASAKGPAASTQVHKNNRQKGKVPIRGR